MEKYTCQKAFEILEQRDNRIYDILNKINYKSHELDKRIDYALKNKDYNTAEELTERNIVLQKREGKLIKKLEEINNQI